MLGLIIGYNARRTEQETAAVAATSRRRRASTDKGATYFQTQCAYEGVGLSPLPENDRKSVKAGEKRYREKRNESDGVGK